MTLSQIDVHSYMGELLELPLRAPSTFPVLDVEGLGPVAANISSSQNANVDGLVFSNTSRGGRDIRLRLGLNVVAGGESVADARLRLYSIFAVAQPVKLVIKREGKPDLTISGIVESATHNMFSPKLEFVIVIRCEKTLLMFTEERSITGAVTQTSIPEVTIQNNGSEIIGFEFQFMFFGGSGATVSLGLTNSFGRTENMYWSGLFSDSLIVETVTRPGERSISQIDTSVETPALQLLRSDSVWGRLYPGVNRIQPNTTIGNPITIMAWTMKYTEAMGGF